jgi:hypothetical protein
VSGNAIQDEDADALTRFGGLRFLDASSNELGAAAAEMLSEELPHLEELRLDFSAIGSPGVVALARNAKSLRKLSAVAVGLSGHGVDELVAVDGVSRLRSLNVSSNELDSRAVETLAAGPFDAMERFQISTDPSEDRFFAGSWHEVHGWGSRTWTWERRLDAEGQPVPRAMAPAKSARAPLQPFDMKKRYVAGDVFLHPTLGEGAVVFAIADRIQVSFPSGDKQLVHGKK